MHDDLLGGVVLFTPGVELPVGADLWGEDHGPEDGAGGGDDGGSDGVGVYGAVPVAEDVGGGVEATFVAGGVGRGIFAVVCVGIIRMIDGVGEALGDDVVEVGVNVGLEAEHVGGGEVLGRGEDLPDALVAVGIGPVGGDGEGVVVGSDAVVGGGEDAAGRVEDVGELVEGDVAGPLTAGSECADGNLTWSRGGEEAAADRDAADGVVGDVALVVGVDEVLRGASPAGEGGGEAGPVGGGVDCEEGVGEVGGIVDGPAEGDAAVVTRVNDAVDDG